MDFVHDIFTTSYWTDILLSLPAIFIALSMHELSHAWVSHMLGDPTPKAQGRLTLHPMAHLDLIGTISLILFGFGWAKPVEVDTRYYKHPKRDMVLVSLAGVIMNFILAFLTLFLLIVLENYVAFPNYDHPSSVYDITMSMIYAVVTINIALGVFNLIPIPPLDGSKVLFSILPERPYRLMITYERYGMILLIAILAFTNVIPTIMNPCVDFISNHFEMLINLIVLR